MRPLHASVIAAAALLAPVTAGHAQSAYDYPWCGVYTSNAGAGGGQACYYTSYAQCMATMRGLGICTQSPYYRGPAVRDDRRRRREYRDY
jgi:hypothetical protein